MCIVSVLNAGIGRYIVASRINQRDSQRPDITLSNQNIECIGNF